MGLWSGGDDLFLLGNEYSHVKHNVKDNIET